MNSHDAPDANTPATDDETVPSSESMQSQEPPAPDAADAAEERRPDGDESDSAAPAPHPLPEGSPVPDEDLVLTAPAFSIAPAPVEDVPAQMAPPAPSVARDATATPGPVTPAAGDPPARSLPTVPEAPRTRWGGIIWGLVFLALAGIGFWSTTALSADFLADVWLRITPLAVGAGMVLIVGVIAVLCALVALARHLQRRSAAQRSLL